MNHRVCLGFLLLCGALGIWAGCTAIFRVPSKDDPVVRCQTIDDCGEHDDARYEYVCDFADGVDRNVGTVDVSKVCITAYRPDVSCNPENYQDTVFAAKHEEAKRSAAYDEACPIPGVRGCRGNCMGTMELNDFDVCDADNTEIPAVPTTYEGEHFDGFDVQDQFCRAFFCDERFVCDQVAKQCIRCNSDGPVYPNGGCGQIYLTGAPSSVYLDADILGDVCVGADARPEDIADMDSAFGPVPAVSK